MVVGRTFFVTLRKVLGFPDVTSAVLVALRKVFWLSNVTSTEVFRSLNVISTFMLTLSGMNVVC